MKITITGSLGNISRPLAEILIRAGHNVTVISSNANKVKEIEALGASAAIGLVDDEAFLTKAFTGADAIYTMVPPNFAAADYRKYIAGIGRIYASAIKASGVKQVVNLSSIGAHLDGGTGPIAGLHDVEEIFSTLENVNIRHIRAAFFYVNFYANIDMIKHMNFIGANYGEHAKMVLVHPNDIAEAVAEELQSSFTGKSIRYVASDERGTDDIASTLGTAIGKPELNWVNFTDEQSLNGMLQAGLPAEIANMYTEMGAAVRSGKLFEDYLVQKPALSKTKLEQFAGEFAKAF